MPDFLGRLPFTVKALFACPVSPVGVDPYPAVMLVGFDSDPVMENREPDILTIFIRAPKWQFAAAIFVHDPAHALEVGGIKVDPGLLALCLAVWRSCRFHCVFHPVPPKINDSRLRQHRLTLVCRFLLILAKKECPIE